MLTMEHVCLCGKVGVGLLCVCECVGEREREDAVVYQYDSGVRIFFAITPSQKLGVRGFRQVVHAEKHKIGSVRICGERIYGERSQK